MSLQFELLSILNQECLAMSPKCSAVGSTMTLASGEDVALYSADVHGPIDHVVLESRLRENVRFMDILRKYDKIGDGTLIELFFKYLPQIIELLPLILPLFLDDEDNTPNVDPVV